MPVTAVRTALSAGGARPSGPKVCVQSEHWYAVLRSVDLCPVADYDAAVGREAPAVWLPGPPTNAAADSVAGPELGAWHRGQDLLLVVDGAAVIGGDAGGIVGGDHQRVDVAAGDRQPEVVTD